MSTTDIQDIADRYLSAIEQEVDEDEQTQLEENRAELTRRYERTKERRGENHGITQRVKASIEKVDEELEQLKTSQQTTAEIREELLNTIATEFELSDEWFTSNVLESMNHALVGERNTELIVEMTAFSSHDDLTELDEIERFDVEETVILLAEDQLSETDEVRTVWTRLQESKYYEPFLIVVERGEASPDDVLDALDGDVSRQNAKNWLNRPIYDWEQLIPYYRVGNGTFGLSTAGQYFAVHYAPSEAGAENEDDSSTAGRGGDENDDQTSLAEVSREAGSDE